MGKPRVPLDPVADLRRRLARGDRRLRVWWHEHELAACPAAVGKRIALALLAQRQPEVKRAGIAVLRHQLGDQLRAGDLPAFARLFEEGHLAERALVDAFATRVLTALLARAPGRMEVADAIAAWRDAETCWQRRAACLAFAALATDPPLVPRAFTLAAGVVWSLAPADQLAVGRLLRALSATAPARVVAFVRRYAHLMSSAAITRAVAALPIGERVDLRARHHRATTLRR